MSIICDERPPTSVFTGLVLDHAFTLDHQWDVVYVWWNWAPRALLRCLADLRFTEWAGPTAKSATGFVDEGLEKVRRMADTMQDSKLFEKTQSLPVSERKD